MPSLIVVSLLFGLLWRLELELRWGWADLTWLGAFHWAYPAGILICLIWMARRLRRVSRRSRMIMLGAATALSTAAYLGGRLTMGWAYSRWLGFLPTWTAWLYYLAPVFLYILLGAVHFAGVDWLCRPLAARFWLGALCYACAFPLAMLLMVITHHRGGPDPVHAIKSGFVFPFIAFGLGLPLTETAIPRTKGECA